MHAKKRWMAVAVPSGDGWDVTMEPVGDLAELPGGLRQRAQGAPVALGLDLPIGLPGLYAERHGGDASDFPAFLRGLGDKSPFFEVCRIPEEISPARPFYPHNALKGPRRKDHAERLGMDFEDFRRVCDAKTGDRPAASALFWTLGANQVGKGALTAWEHLLRPALAGPDPPALWPFDGDFLKSLASGRTVVAETYPAEAMRQLGIKMNGSKRRQADRKALAPQLRDRLRDMSARPDRALASLVSDGFGRSGDGEDTFDALMGLLGMLRVVQGKQPDAVPADTKVRRWEGWILGQAVPDPAPTPRLQPTSDKF